MHGNALRVAHFSDLHYSPANLVESDRCLAFGLERAIGDACQVAVFSGDATDHRLEVHAPAFAALARRVHQLSRHCPILMLQGTFSHEPPGTLDLLRLIDAQHPVYVADRIHQVALCGSVFVPSDDAAFSPAELDVLLAQHGMPEVIFTCVPTVNKATLAATAGIADAATAVGGYLAAYLKAAGAINRQVREWGVRTIGVSHGTVNGCETEHGVPMAGFDHEFSIGALFDAECDAFMLGHIHRAQQWEREGRVVAYPGSIGRFHYGEIGAKGFLRWNIEPGRATAELITTPARETICVDFDGPPDMQRLAEMAADAMGKFVRIRWTINEEHRQLVDREAIQALFAASAEVKIEARILPAVRSRAEGISRTVTLAEKLVRWSELVGVDATPVVDRLSQLERLDAKAIADSVLSGLTATTALLEEQESTVPADQPANLPDLGAEPIAAAHPPQLEWLSDDLFAAEAA
nr:DNA repair exonuclease [Cupriavidus sp. WS]